MARIIDEMLEGVGYEESWSETIVGTGVLDEDFATSSVTGSPGDWASQCLRVVTDGTNNTFTARDFGSNQDITYTRIEIVVIDVSGLTANDVSGIARCTNLAGTVRWLLSVVKDGSGSPKFRCDLRYDGSTHSFTTTATVNLNQRYRHEIRWDVTNDVAEWRIDGSTETMQTLSVETPIRIWELGSRGADTTSGASAEYALDNVALDDTDWVGAEAGGGGGSFPPLLRSFDPAYLRI